MTLQADELLQAYEHLYRVFPEDVHIARPLIQVAQKKGDTDTAYHIAEAMGRRMFSIGQISLAQAFLKLSLSLSDEGKEDIESMLAMAEVMTDTLQEGRSQVFSLIEGLSDQEALEFIQEASLVTCQAGEVLIRQGEVGHHFYVILQGHMGVSIHKNDGTELHIKTLSDGDYFGEYACIYQLPRTATIVANEDTLLLEFPDTAISSLMEKSSEAGDILMGVVAQRLIQSMTHVHPSFADIVEGDHAWVAEESRIVDLSQGDPLLYDGLYAYMLLHGELQVLRDGQSVGVLHEGDMFSDLNSHLQIPQGAEIQAAQRSLVCQIPKDIFESFMRAYGSFERWVEEQHMDLEG